MHWSFDAFPESITRPAPSSMTGVVKNVSPAPAGNLIKLDTASSAG